MNKTLAAAAFSAFMATGAAADTTQPTAADECMDEVFTAYKSDLVESLLNVRANLSERNIVMESFGALFGKEQTRTIASVCEIITDSEITAASSDYMDQDGYTMEVSAP